MDIWTEWCDRYPSSKLPGGLYINLYYQTRIKSHVTAHSIHFDPTHRHTLSNSLQVPKKHKLREDAIHQYNEWKRIIPSLVKPMLDLLTKTSHYYAAMQQVRREKDHASSMSFLGS